VKEAWKFGCSRLFTTTGTYTSTANAVGTSVVDERAVMAGPTNATVVATVPKPHLTLTKTASPGSGVAPLAVTFSYTVLNDGDATTTLSDVAVTDAQCGPVARTGADAGSDGLLSVGETWRLTCSTSFAAPGNYSGTAVARGVNTVAGQPVASDPSGTTISVDAPPVVVPDAPAPAPVATATPRPPSVRVTIPLRARFRARGCDGRAALTLKAGGRVVATKTAKLDRNCRYSVRFNVVRARLRGARTVTISVRAGRRTATHRVAVPR